MAASTPAGLASLHSGPARRADDVVVGLNGKTTRSGKWRKYLTKRIGEWMSQDERRAHWHIWIRPRGVRLRSLTIALMAIAERRRGTIVSPSSGTVVALRRNEVQGLVGALRDPFGAYLDDAHEEIRMKIIRAVGDQLTSSAGDAGGSAGDDEPVGEMFPQYLVPMLPGRRAASTLAVLINRLSRGDRADVLDPSEACVYIFLRGSDLSLRDLLMSTDPRICNEEMRAGLIEDFQEYLHES